MTKLTPRIFNKTLRTLHLALTAGPSFFAVVTYFIAPDQYFDYMKTDDILFFVVPIIGITAIVISAFLFAKQKRELLKKETLKEKLVGYQGASIIKYGLIEGPALLAIVIFFKFGNLFYLIIAVLFIVYLILQRPTKAKIEQDLQLDFEQLNEYNQLDKELE
ncbi:MAG: hypothetical protein ABJM06_11440 [Gilvibacter sp.]